MHDVLTVDPFRSAWRQTFWFSFSIRPGQQEDLLSYLVTAQVVRRQNGNSSDVDELRRLLEEVSKLPAAYSRAIVNSDS